MYHVPQASLTFSDSSRSLQVPRTPSSKTPHEEHPDETPKPLPIMSFSAHKWRDQRSHQNPKTHHEPSTHPPPIANPVSHDQTRLHLPSQASRAPKAPNLLLRPLARQLPNSHLADWATQVGEWAFRCRRRPRCVPGSPLGDPRAVLNGALELKIGLSYHILVQVLLLLFLFPTRMYCCEGGQETPRHVITGLLRKSWPIVIQVFL
ncbi:hypothetical protein V8C26DRAFT_257522 [Trichoderma gracile]